METDLGFRTEFIVPFNLLLIGFPVLDDSLQPIIELPSFASPSLLCSAVANEPQKST